ncbi:metallophosphoesterase [Pleurocapsales cyanobacterium LEGE 06147]|nr:metallophosphoesterase [Pleurocapsales cyanobacterium LEGE 06147]
MNLHRRRFLMVLASLGGLGIAVVTRLSLTSHSATKTTFHNKGVNLRQKQQIANNSSSQKSLERENLSPGDIRIVVISDLNSQYGSTTYEPEVDRAIALIPEWQPDLVLCGGDMIAGQKRSLTESQIKAMWTAFDRHIAAPLRDSGIPFGFTIGNHDGSGAVVQEKLIFQNERELASAYWNESQHDPGLSFIDRGNFPFYYTFSQNEIFYLVWDASTHIISPQQLAWVEQSLASDRAQRASIRIVIGHLPLYAVAVGRDKPGEYLNNAEKLRSLLERYRVHTYISGHHHAYYPGKKGHLELLHTGALGSGPRQLLNSNLPARKTITVVDIFLASATTVYTTYDMQTLEIVSDRSLPEIIFAPNGKVFRRDLR